MARQSRTSNGVTSNALKLGLLLMMASVPTYAQTQEMRFDAVCEGFGVIAARRDDLKNKNRTPGIKRFRIDLENKRWCLNACEETFPIHSIDQKYLILRSESDQVFESYISINRENGRIVDLNTVFSKSREDDGVFNFTGECKREAFSGFPVSRF